jgi:hypothetical protein
VLSIHKEVKFTAEQIEDELNKLAKEESEGKKPIYISTLMSAQEMERELQENFHRNLMKLVDSGVVSMATYSKSGEITVFYWID